MITFKTETSEVGVAFVLLQCGRAGFDPWLGKMPWRRERLPTPIFWPGEFHGLFMGSQRVGQD